MKLTKETKLVPVYLPIDVVNVLAKEAAKKGISRNTLCRMLLVEAADKYSQGV